MRIILILIYNIVNIHNMECECESFSFSFWQSLTIFKICKIVGMIIAKLFNIQHLICISIQYLYNPLLYIHPHPQRPRLALYGMIFFLVLGYRFSIRLSLIPSDSLTIWKILARSLHIPLSFRLGMLVACCYLAWFLHCYNTWHGSCNAGANSYTWHDSCMAK